MLGGVSLYYTNQAIPFSVVDEVYTINYYDNYTFDLDGGTDPGMVYNVSTATDVEGLATGSKVKILGSTNSWITTVSYYDDKGRVIYTYSKNDYLNTVDVIENKLDFGGKVLETKTTHTKDSNPAIVTIDKFKYDDASRLEKQEQELGGNTELIAANTYDGIGQLVQKKVGNNENTPLQEVNFDYNVRGWLTDINDVNSPATADRLFSMEIQYNNRGNTPGNLTDLLYNGNISATIWKTINDENSSVTHRRYGYIYDALNRIVNSIYVTKHQSGPDTYGYNASMLYDFNGNITELDRLTLESNGLSTYIDRLDYTYDTGNKLTSVLDNHSSSLIQEGFLDGNTVGDDYDYDTNGNLTMDLNKGIQADGISYNHLNLPTEVKFDNNDQKKITYIYDATGVKLQKAVEQPGLSSVTTDYAGNYIYEGSTLQFFNHPEGYVEPDGSGYDYIFQCKDHLGNIRLSYADDDGNGSIDPTTEIREENNYYPFGLKHKGYNTMQSASRDHKYGFGRKRRTG